VLSRELTSNGKYQVEVRMTAEKAEEFRRRNKPDSSAA
jgi:hypothetical protein